MWLGESPLVPATATGIVDRSTEVSNTLPSRRKCRPRRDHDEWRDFAVSAEWLTLRPSRRGRTRWSS
jgi:hypothetical protein